MRIEDLDARWQAVSEEVLTGMKDWRVQHPKATFREIEAALDERLARLRARMLLAASGALGLFFLVVKAFEYAREIAAGNDIDSEPFFTLYFLVTGFHALHVVLGLFILAIVAKIATPSAIETGTAFWHMVDLVWVLVFPCFYLLR